MCLEDLLSDEADALRAELAAVKAERDALARFPVYMGDHAGRWFVRHNYGVPGLNLGPHPTEAAAVAVVVAFAREAAGLAATTEGE